MFCIMATPASLPSVPPMFLGGLVTQEWFMKLKEWIDYLAAAFRAQTVTVLAGDASVDVTLATGERVASAAIQEENGIVWQGVSISGNTHTVKFSDTASADMEVILTIVKL